MKQYDHVKNFTFDGKRYKLRGNSEKDVIIKMANKIRDLEEGKVVISNTMTVRAWSVKAVEIYRTNQGDINEREIYAVYEALHIRAYRGMEFTRCSTSFFGKL